MLSTSESAAAFRATRPGGARRVRNLQRAIHLVSAVILVGFVYLTPAPGSPALLAVRWVALPVLVLSGIALWKWHVVRRYLPRGRRA